MLKKRVIPVLLLKDGRMVKGKQFSNYVDTGNPQTAVRIYSSQDADELVFLDIQASQESRKAMFHIIETAASEAFMPLTVGGGINKISEIRDLLLAGADKVVINSALIENPKFIKEASEIFGAQCIVAGIDFKLENSIYKVWSHSGKKATALDPISHVKQMESLGAGEIFLNSIDRDGMMSGLDLLIAEQVSKSVNIPVIICGGAGNFMHLAEAFLKTDVSAVACASLFHFGDNNPIRARSYLRNLGINMRVLK